MDVYHKSVRFLSVFTILGVACLGFAAPSVFAKEVADMGAPSAPVSLMGSSAANQIMLTWDFGEYDINAGLGFPDTFVVYRTQGANVNFSGLQPITIISSNSHSYVDTSVQPNVVYHYKVAARLGDKESMNSSVLMLANSGDSSAVAGRGPLTTDLLATLAAPVVSGRVVAVNQAVLSWPAVAGAQSYKIYRGASANGLFIVAGSASTTNWADANLDYNASYYYYVTAKAGTAPDYSQADEGLQSATVLVKTLDQNAKPAAPVVTGRATATNQITLSWSGVLGAQSYRIYRSVAVNGLSVIAGSTTGTSWTDTNLDYNTTYYYYVAAKSGIYPEYSQADEGPQSTVVVVRTLDQTAKLTAPVVTGRGLSVASVQLNWAAVPLAVRYRLKRDYSGYTQAGIGQFPNEGVIVDGTSYIDAQAFPLVRYTYSLVAVGADGSQGPNSAPVTVELAPKPVVPQATVSRVTLYVTGIASNATVYVKRNKTVRFSYTYSNGTAAPQPVRIVRQLISPTGKVLQGNGAGAYQTIAARRTVSFSPPLISTSLTPGLYRVSVKVYSTVAADRGKLLAEKSFSIQVQY
jgi:fibronectin type 3 domain-containing protein